MTKKQGLLKSAQHCEKAACALYDKVLGHVGLSEKMRKQLTLWRKEHEQAAARLQEISPGVFEDLDAREDPLTVLVDTASIEKDPLVVHALREEEERCLLTYENILKVPDLHETVDAWVEMEILPSVRARIQGMERFFRKSSAA